MQIANHQSFENNSLHTNSIAHKSAGDLHSNNSKSNADFDLKSYDHDHKNNHLHDELIRLVKFERRLTSKILDLLQQVEDRKSYLSWGYSNLFQYLVKGLNYSEALAYQRKAALRICETLPEVKTKLDQGSLSLTTLARASRVLNTKNIQEKRELITQLENKSTREVDKILASAGPLQTTPGPAKRYVNESTVRVTLDFSENEFENLERLKALKSHTVKDFKDLVAILVDNELEKYNRTSKLSSRSTNPRQIKNSLKNHLLQKADYRCQYPGCDQNHFLQIDHILSVSKGGQNQVSNLQVLCQAHNQFKYLNEG